MRTARPAILSLALLLLLPAGCAVSKPFSAGVSAAVPLVAKDAARYAVGAGQKIDGDALSTAATAKDASAATVGAAWEKVRAWYVPAVQADPKLDVDERSLRLENAARLDKLLADERNRPLAGGS